MFELVALQFGIGSHTAADLHCAGSGDPAGDLALPSAGGGRAMSIALTAATWTCRSIRWSKGPDKRA